MTEIKAIKAIKAIETSYAGCRFRSRLEARWAVFFDTLGIPWEYEPQGYAVDNGAYLPDFWLPTVEAQPVSDAQGTFFEVKPDIPSTPEDPKWRGVVRPGRPLVVAFGLPNVDRDVIWGSGRPYGHMEVIFWDDPIDAEDESDGTTSWDNGRAFVVCPMCKRVGIVFGGWLDRLSCKHVSSRFDGTDDPALVRAYRAARSARFEHGQSGAPA